MTTAATLRLGFFRALTLTERLRLRAEASLAPATTPAPTTTTVPMPPTARTTAVTTAAGDALARWRSEPAFASAIELDDRLALESIDADAFAAVLQEPAEVAHERLSEPPAWLVEIQAAYAERCEHADPEPGRPPMARFLEALEPLTARARTRLRSELDRLRAVPSGPGFDPQRIERAFAVTLDQTLLGMISRTFALELQVASLQGTLVGQTAEERFADFANRLGAPDRMLDLLEEYAVLARAIVETIGRWERVSTEIVERLLADWPEIARQIFAEGDPGELVGVDGDAGDVHRGGRSVRLLRFASGARLVYKPRPLGVDRRFQELLAWLNERGDHPPFRVLTIIEGESHGWSEFAAGETCETVEEVQRFYRRLGAFLALFYALEATDLHHGNLIAAGEQPILHDVEALFQPRVGGADLGRADDVAWSTMNHSVLRVGLLPMWIGATDAPIDISGIGTIAGELSPYPVPYWEGEGTDAMTLARRPMRMRGADNRPTIAGATVDVLDFRDAIIGGFAGMYRILVARRGELDAPDGPLRRFARDEVRMLLRPTRTYAALLRESFHPDVLRDALDRDRLLDRLWLAADTCPELLSAVPAERADLLQGDIPLFATRPDSRDLVDAMGRVLPDFLDETGMDQVRSRLTRLSEQDLTQQLWFIRASLSTLSPPPRGSHALPRRPSERVEPPTRQQLIGTARAVGDRLAALALHGDRDVSWVGLSITGRERWWLVALGLDLYDGLPGVALFLARLGDVTGDERYTKLARSALATLRHQVSMSRTSLFTVGAFTGWGGVVYALTQLGVLWDDESLLSEATETTGLIAGLIDEDTGYDVVAGSAGAIAALLGLHAVAPSEPVLATAVRAGEHLIATALHTADGTGRLLDAAGAPLLAGFSHGAAGIAWALLRLGEVTGDGRFLAAARTAIDYERTLFVPEKGNWRDLRPQPDGVEHDQSSWCHGAMGIGLARLNTLPLLDHTSRHEVDTALETTLRLGLGENQSLCHGTVGNLELFSEASKRLDRQRWQPHVDRMAAQVLNDIGCHGWYCGTSQGVESPGLMTGLAGIGYGLLRLAAPERVPSVLTLEPAAR